MGMTKEQLKKWHGVIDWKRVERKSVLARRHVHIKFSNAMDRFLMPGFWLIVYFGFVVIVLPEFFPSWKEIVTGRPILSDYYIFFVDEHRNTPPGGIFMALWLVCEITIVVFRKYLPGGGGGDRRRIFRPKYGEVIAMNLYPRTLMEEVFFYSNAVLGVFISLGLSYVFGVFVSNFF